MSAFDEAVERARKAVGKAIANGALPSGIARAALKAACEGLPVYCPSDDMPHVRGPVALLPLPEEAPNGEREEV